MSDMSDATKEKIHSHIFYKYEPAQRSFIISTSVFTPPELIIEKVGDGHPWVISLMDVCTKSEYIFHCSIPDKKLTESEMLIQSHLWPLILLN